MARPKKERVQLTRAELAKSAAARAQNYKMLARNVLCPYARERLLTKALELEAIARAHLETIAPVQAQAPSPRATAIDQ